MHLIASGAPPVADGQFARTVSNHSIHSEMSSSQVVPTCSRWAVLPKLYLITVYSLRCLHRKWCPPVADGQFARVDAVLALNSPRLALDELHSPVSCVQLGSVELRVQHDRAISPPPRSLAEVTVSAEHMPAGESKHDVRMLFISVPQGLFSKTEALVFRFKTL